MDELGAAIQEVIHFKTLRSKISSVHPDLLAEGITRVEVAQDGFRFIKTQPKCELAIKNMPFKIMLAY